MRVRQPKQQMQQMLKASFLNKKYASELGLNRTRFDAELDAGTYAAEIKHDIQDGEIYGIDSTPTIFVNGVMLRTMSEEALRAAIDHAAASPQASASPK